jgi:hypothetical protein
MNTYEHLHFESVGVHKTLRHHDASLGDEPMHL